MSRAAASVEVVWDLVEVPARARAADGLRDDGVVADQVLVRRAGATPGRWCRRGRRLGSGSGGRLLRGCAPGGSFARAGLSAPAAPATGPAAAGLGRGAGGRLGFPRRWLGGRG